MTVRGELAQRWESTPDATSFTFHLDPEAQWHDGSPVVAQDVVRGLQRVVDGTLEPVSLHGPLLEQVVGYSVARTGRPLRGVGALDEHTVRIDLTAPMPELPSLLAHPALAPVPPAAADDPAAFGEAPVGNGPFELGDRWAHNQFLRLVPSSSHPTPDAIGDVVFRVYADDEDRTVRYADLLAGQLQVAPLPLGRRDEALATYGSAPIGGGTGVHEGLTDTVSLLTFDTRVEPFDDERFRRAVSLLVDRPGLASRTDGARLPADALVPPGIPGAQRGVCRWCTHDPETAATLVAAVLAERPVDAPPLPPIVIQTSTDGLHGALADQLSVALRGFGLSVRIVRPSPAGYLESVEAEGSAIVRLGWSPSTPTLAAWTEDLLAAGQPAARLSGWQPQALTALLERARSSADASVRRASWQEVERLALDAAVVAPVLFYRQEVVVGDGVRGLSFDALGAVDLERVRLVPAEQDEAA